MRSVGAMTFSSRFQSCHVNLGCRRDEATNLGVVAVSPLEVRCQTSLIVLYILAVVLRKLDKQPSKEMSLSFDAETILILVLKGDHGFSQQVESSPLCMSADHEAAVKQASSSCLSC